MNEEALKLLYDSYAKDKGFKDYDEFKGLIADDNARKLFFEESNSDLGFKDQSDFEDTIGFKKKADTWQKSALEQMLPSGQSASGSQSPSQGAVPAVEKTSTQERSLVGKTPEETQALLFANAQEGQNKKAGITTDRPILKKFDKDLTGEIKSSSDSLSSIYDKQYELLDKSMKSRAVEQKKNGASDEEIQAEIQSNVNKFNETRTKEYQNKMSSIYSEKLDKYRNLSEKELKSENDLERSAREAVEKIAKSAEDKDGKVKSVAKAFIKNITNISTNGYAQAFANSKASYVENFDERIKKDGTNAFQEPRVSLAAIDHKEDTGKSLYDLYKVSLENLMSVEDPDKNLIDKDKITRDALVKTYELLGNRDVSNDEFRDVFKAKYNTTAGEYKKDYVSKAEKKGDASAVLLSDIPNTWEEAKETGKIAEYLSGGVGEIIGSSVISVGTLGAGGVILNTGEVYDKLLTDYSKDLSERVGKNISKEEIVSNSQDKDVVHMTEYMAPIVSSLDLAGTLFGAGRTAKNLFSKKIIDAASRQLTKKGAVAIIKSGASAAAKGLLYPAVAEVSTEVSQSLIPMLGSNIIASKIRKGMDIDEAITSLSNEEVDELFEVARKVGLSMGILGGPGSVVQGLSSAANDISNNHKFDQSKMEVIEDKNGNQFVVSKEIPNNKVVKKSDGTLSSIVEENKEESVKPKLDKEPKSTVDQSEIIEKAVESGQAYELTPELAEQYASGKDKSMAKLGKVAGNLYKAIGKIKSIPPKVVLLSDNESAKSVAASLGFDVKSDDKINGWYNRDTNTMFITPNTNTAIHEIMMHPVIDALKQTAPERYEEFIQQVANLKTKDKDGNETTFLDKAKKNYEGSSVEVINEEAVVDYLTGIADKGFDSNFLQKIVELFEKYFNVKVGEFNINLDNPTDVQIFAKDLTKALRQSRPVVLTKDQAVPASARVQIDDVKSKKKEGVTFNPDFSEYTGEDDVVTIASENVKESDLTPERINEFKSKHQESLKEKNVKIGIFDMGGGNYSIDLNVTQPFESQEKTKEFAKANNQKAIYSPKGGGVIETGGTGETTIKSPSEATEAIKKINSPESQYKDNSSKTQEFFSDVVTGKSDKFKPVKPYSPIMKNNKAQENFNKEYSKFKGNFDEHIATSIPGFRDVQVKKGRAIIDALPEGGLVIDIAGSEGGLNKSITKISKGKIKTINLDVNKDMQAAHNNNPVKGAEFKLGAFFNDYEEDGFTAKRWIPENKADVVHESMGFQFMSPQRELHIKEVKDNYLKGDGMLIVEEKVGNPKWEENEIKKDKDFKSRFYTKEQIEEKNKAVKVSDFDANEGMAGNMVTEEKLLRDLGSNFNYIQQYWDAGNFKGYVASNDKVKIDRFMKSIGSTNTEFSNRSDSELKSVGLNNKKTSGNRISSPELLYIKDQYNTYNDISTEQVDPNGVFTPDDINRVEKLHRESKDDRTSDDVLDTYKAFMDETMEMYNTLIDNGYKIEPWTKPGEPYGVNSDLVRKDINENKHLYYLRSKSATGANEQSSLDDSYPLFRETGIVINGDPVLYNDLFRAVHDIFGHGIYKNSFSTQGEFKAYQAHSNMYSPEAQSALFLETVSYNAYYSVNKEYAPRKMYVVPDSIIKSIRESAPSKSNISFSQEKGTERRSNPVSFQAEKLIGTEIQSAKPITTTASVAKFLNSWAKKNNIFGRKNIEKMDESKAVDILVPQIRKELQAWDEFMASDYRGFYDQDVAIDVDNRLKKFAQDRYKRQLSDQEVALYHVLSAFASPSATPEFDSQKGLLLFDRYLRTGEVEPYDYSKDADVYQKNEKGIKVPTGEKKKNPDGSPVFPQVSVAYASQSLDKFNEIVEKVGGPDKAIDWISSQHSYEELSEMAGKPIKGKDAMKEHEYLSKEDGGYGVFAISGPKLGSYILNRIGNLDTVTKDMWYARSMARLFGEPLVDGKKAIKKPWEPSTKIGNKKRVIADKAFKILSDERGVSPAVIQQQLWDFEKKLWQQIGADDISKPVTALSGINKGIDQVYQDRGLISKAERIERENLPTAKPLENAPFSKEKVTKTTERVVAPENSEFENLHNAFDATNPDPRFTGKSQETKKMLDKMYSMTDDEISSEAQKMGSDKLLDLAKSFKGNQNFSLLFLIEKMKRAARANDNAAVDNTWDAVNQIGHTVGQLLAQMRALQSAADNNQIIKRIIDRVFKKADVNLTNDQKAELSDLVEKYVITAAEEKKQYERYDVNRTPVNKGRLDKSRQNARAAAEDLQIFIDDHVPETLMDTLGTLLRGNLLSPISLGRNVFGNTISMATSFTEAGIVYPMAAKLASPKNARFLPYWVPVMAGARGGWTTLKTLFPSLSDAYFGTHYLATDDVISNKFEVRRQLRPLRSAKKLFTTLPREVRSGEKSVPQGLKEGLQNLLYATAGIPASLMFKALQATDAPFAEGFKAYHDYIEFYSQKKNAGKSISNLEDFQRNLTESQKTDRNKFARTGLFSDPDSFAAKAARKIITQTPQEIARYTTESFPRFISEPMNAAMFFMRDALAPYTTVPSNVVWTFLEYAVPAIPLIESIQQFKKGNKVLASQLMGRAMNGVAMYYTAALISEAGLMIDGDDDRNEKNDKQLKYAVGQPYGLNVDGLGRLVSGGDPTRLDTDRIVDSRMLGQPGLFMAYYSNYARKLRESGVEERPTDFIQDSVDKITIGASEGTRLALDMSFMMGIETALTSLFNVDQEAKGLGYFPSLASQTLDTYSNAIWPNTLSQAIIGAENQGPLSISRESFAKNLSERVAKKHFFFMKPDDLYPTLDIWGNKIENKEGIKNMANLWKSRTQRDPQAWEVLRLMDSTGEENPIYIATPSIEIDTEEGKVKLNLQDSDKFLLASLSGRFTHMLVSAAMNDPQYSDLTDAERVVVIKDQNTEGRRIARDIFSGLFMNDIEDGKIKITDKKEGRYERVDKTTPEAQQSQSDEIINDAN